MVKIPLNKTELHSLIGLILGADYNSIEDIDIRELVGPQIKRLLRRLDNKLCNFPEKKKETNMGFKPADLAALHKTLLTYLPSRLHAYEDVLITKINMIIEQKAA